MSGHPEVTDGLATDHGLLGNRSITDFGDGVGTHARLAERPRELTVGDPRDVLSTRSAYGWDTLCERLTASPNPGLYWKP